MPGRPATTLSLPPDRMLSWIQLYKPPATALVLVALVALLNATGCRTTRPPPPPPLERAQLIHALRARSEGFHTLVDSDITLITSMFKDGEEQKGPALGGHIAFDRDVPALWLVTEKMGRQVFSLQAVGARFHLAIPKTREVVTGGPRAYGRLPHLVRPDEVSRILGGPDALGLSWPSTTMEVEPTAYRFEVTSLERPYMEVLVDRWEVAIRRIRRYDVLGRAVTDVRLHDYRAVEGLPFPHRLVVLRPLYGTKIDLRLGSPKLNKSIPPEAFEPAEHPGWDHVDLDRRPLSDVKAFRED